MTAVVTNEASFWKRCHLSKLIVFDAVRAPNYRHGHFGIHREAASGGGWPEF
jgi:hypothetical protein